jgi:hypothetical protein
MDHQNAEHGTGEHIGRQKGKFERGKHHVGQFRENCCIDWRQLKASGVNLENETRSILHLRSSPGLTR